MDIINLKQVSKVYLGSISAIENISFSIERGELVFLAGHSGAGKSTILKLIAGIETASSGNVIVNGFDLSTTKLNHRTFIRQHIGFIFQDHKILYDRNVFDNVRLSLDIMEYPEHIIKKRVLSALQSVGLEDKIKATPESLSGGEQQRVAIARAIVNEPQILFADEPTGNLDSVNSASIMDLLLGLADETGATLIVVTHDKSLAEKGDRTLTIKDGVIV